MTEANIVVFDLDGTLANMDHRLHHIQKEKKDWDAFFCACSDDEPMEATISMFQALKAAGHYMVIFTGRSDIAEQDTVSWLYGNDLDFDRIMMRKQGDYRMDLELKKIWIDQYGYRGKILMAFEDRARVVKMWRDEGILCFQCAEGDF